MFAIGGNLMKHSLDTLKVCQQHRYCFHHTLPLGHLNVDDTEGSSKQFATAAPLSSVRHVTNSVTLGSGPGISPDFRLNKWLFYVPQSVTSECNTGVQAVDALPFNPHAQPDDSSGLYLPTAG